MSLAPHLHPKTYWEERCELLEESLLRALNIIVMCGSPQQRQMLQAHVDHWQKIIGSLAEKYPAPEQDSGIGGEKPPEPPNGWSAERHAQYLADVKTAGKKP